MKNKFGCAPVEPNQLICIYVPEGDICIHVEGIDIYGRDYSKLYTVNTREKKMDKKIKKIQKDTKHLEKEEKALLKADKKRDAKCEYGEKMMKKKKKK